jgi:hypothetical protein
MKNCDLTAPILLVFIEYSMFDAVSAAAQYFRPDRADFVGLIVSSEFDAVSAAAQIFRPDRADFGYSYSI